MTTTMIVFQFDGFVAEHEDFIPFKARIEAPVAGSERDYFCVVAAQPLLGTAKRIFGYDAAQAIGLALDFLRTITSGHRIYDADKSVVDFTDHLKKGRT